MQRPHFNTARVLFVFLAGCFGWGGQSFAQNPTNVSSVQVSGFDRQVRTFLQNEVTAHVADIKTLNPPPDRVVGALTTGEFSWGTFMRTLAARYVSFRPRPGRQFGVWVVRDGNFHGFGGSGWPYQAPANPIETTFLNGARQDQLLSNDVNLDVQVLHSDWPLRFSAFAPGDDPLGRGSRGPIPLHLVLESNDI